MSINPLKLLPRQDVCFFCAIRSTLRSQRPAQTLTAQRRAYQSSAASLHPAAAALRIEEEDDGASQHGRELVGWRCQCTHVNRPHRSECTVCLTPKSNKLPLVYKGDVPSSPALAPLPQAQPRDVASQRPGIGTPPNLTSPSTDRRRTNFRQSLSENTLGQIGNPSGQDSQGSAGKVPSAARVRRNDQQFAPSGPVTRYQNYAGHEPRSKYLESGGADPPGFFGTRKLTFNRNESGSSFDTLSPISSSRSGMGNVRDRRMQNVAPPNRFQTRGLPERSGNDGGWFYPQQSQPPQPTHQPRLSRQDQKPIRWTPFGSSPGENDSRDQGVGSEAQSSSQQLRSGNGQGQRERFGYQNRHGVDGRANSTQREQFQNRGESQWRVGEAAFRRVVPGAQFDPMAPSEAGSQGIQDFEQSEETQIGSVGIEVMGGAGFGQSHRKKLTTRDGHRRSRIYEIDEIDEAAGPMPAFRQSAARARTTGVSRRSREFDDDEFDTPRSARVSKGSRGSSRWDDDDDYEALDEDEMASPRQRRKAAKNRRQRKASDAARPEVHLPEFISVERLAQALKVKLDPFIAQLEEEGFEGARYDHILDSSTSAMFADLYGFEPVISTAEDAQDLVARPAPEDYSALPTRPPIVTIMGHVDHGKTTILDYLRKSSVVASEHGGITQHIGAFSVIMPGSDRKITFLDTPGHAAFLDMRRRGANVTDIVVLVVAADDGVMPQTIEAIKHAREANVQIIVAINKVDKEDANIERVKQTLAQNDIVVEDYGGDYQAIPVSGKTGRGMADLEEAITLLADVADFRAEIDGPVEGWIIESKVTTAGRVATVLVRRGTLKPGDYIVAGTTWARVRTLKNDAGQFLEEAPPGTPVQVDGWRGADPDAGLEVLQADNEHHAKEVVELRTEKAEAMRATTEVAALNVARSEEADARARQLDWEREQGHHDVAFWRRPKDNEGWIEKASSGPQRVHFVIKADVAGSCEALVHAVSALGNNEIVANIIHSGVGGLRESDIKMLAATGEKGYAISFNQSVENSIRRLAEVAELEILDHNIIYKVTDDVTEKLTDALPPLITQRVLGEAEIGQLFDITVKKKLVKIAGCKVTNGTISRSNSVRVLRHGEVVYTGMLDSLKNVKKDVTEMRKGTECGMAFEGWDGFREGDQIQCFEEIKEKRTL
ncbi:translation initiation factor IF-2 [Exophiala aquamarina CBS 119918]|uniref:Translation initiation factor IF-2, mitochondrial n=1 Tax=Exophiala aquamarina CBS 119918 TaxID=1182545 RepID=A0A072NUT2_9EURO|nr:translation initiation factor IF-2 [Exophiala aquamarina CBS 119918]KEF51376.1 translation initiation factor IF-2 [Exophiala aquamarina CBS 119918]